MIYGHYLVIAPSGDTTIKLLPIKLSNN